MKKCSNPTTTKAHRCYPSRQCCCSATALEPNEHCEIHGAGDYPARCEKCGRFFKRRWDDRTSMVSQYEKELAKWQAPESLGDI